MIYPRNKREIITINGTFDPCRDPTEMSEIWHFVGKGLDGANGVVWSQVAAPGSIGGYAHRFSGKTTLQDKYALQGISPYRNNGFQYFFSPFSPFYWKVTAKFRVYIEDDYANASCFQGNANGAMFFFDGLVYSYTNSISQVEVPDERCGLTLNAATNCMNMFSWDTSGGVQDRSWQSVNINYDQWYDVEVQMTFDWFKNPRYIFCEAFLDGVSIITHNWEWTDNWRGTFSSIFGSHIPLGRCGIGMDVTHSSTEGIDMGCYFKDIVITQEFKPVNWKVEDNIIQAGRVSTAEVAIISKEVPSFAEGSDLNIWKRNSIADEWQPRFRGIIREVDRGETKRLCTLIAEGYETLLYGEKTKNISHSTKTAKEIVQDAINNPDKGDFNVTTYFESPTTTYNREYPQNSKIDIVQEMSGLEGFICFVVHTNYWHFQSYRTNQLAKHLIYGQSRIRKVKVNNVYVRKPSLIRVIGKGYVSERELAVDTYSSGSNVVRNFNRLDLTTQAEVDDALDFYCSLMNEPIRVVEVFMRADHELQKGHLIRFTDTNHGIKNRQFLIASVACEKTGLMTLSLLEAKPHITALISDLSSRTDTKESEMFPQDAVTATPEFNIEGVATVNITGTYELEYDSTIVRSGDLVITDELIDDLLEFWNMESPTQPTHLGYGTGTEEPLFSDTDLETETARTSVSVAFKEEINYSAWNYYRAVEFSIDVVNPSAITEIGLFNAASNGTLGCRGVFESYSQTGTVTFRIRLRVEPVQGLCYVTFGGRHEMIVWLGNGTAITTYTHIAHYGFKSFIAPLPCVAYRGTGIGFYAVWVPDTAAQGSGSFTKNKLPERNMIKFQHTYGPYNYSSDKGSDGTAQTDPQDRFIALRNNHATRANRRQHIVLFHRSTKILENFDGSYCKWIIWLKIISGETEYSN